MKKRNLYSILAMGVLILAVGCSKQASVATTSTQPVAAATQTVKLALVNNAPPSIYFDDKNQLVGYEVELLKEINKKLPEYKFEFDTMDQAAVLVGVESGKYALGSGNFLKTTDREEKFLFTDETINLTLMKLLVKKDRTDINSLADLVGKKVVPLAAGDARYKIIQDYNKANPDKSIKLDAVDSSLATPADGFKAVDSGRYDAFVIPSMAFDTIQKQLNLNVKMTDTINKAPSFFIFNKTQPELKTKVDKALKELKQDGTVSKISIKYFNEDVLKR